MSEILSVKAIQQVTLLSRYYQITRRVGHTNLMIQGAQNSTRQFALIVPTLKYGNELITRYNIKNCRLISLSKLQDLQGLNLPICLDNFTLIELLEDIDNHNCLMEQQLMNATGQVSVYRASMFNIYHTLYNTRWNLKEFAYFDENKHDDFELHSRIKALLNTQKLELEKTQLLLAEIESSIWLYIRHRFTKFIQKFKKKK